VALERDCDRPRDDDAALVLEATPDGVREQRSDALAIAPVIRESMLAEPDAVIFPNPIQPTPLSFAAAEMDRHPRARPDEDEQPVESIDERPAHSGRG